MPVVLVRYLGILERRAGVREEVLTMPPEATLRAVLAEVCRRHDALASLALAESGAPAEAILISVNDVANPELDCALAENTHMTVVLLSPMMAGGQTAARPTGSGRG
ncbi:MAG: hypothetical protein QN152_01905 [Armatimonadota bacterium]|nr:hypothetical protein [Armatimonadota bacterium]MDR7475737.1 hypothetical protein [Armatimonadota bacterium]MDR7538275.1 hypothetical protein [Armatimonadota bacterium]